MNQAELKVWLASQGVEFDAIRSMRLTLTPGGPDDQPVLVDVDSYKRDDKGHHFLIHDDEATDSPVVATERRLLHTRDIGLVNHTPAQPGEIDAVSVPQMSSAFERKVPVTP